MKTCKILPICLLAMLLGFSSCEKDEPETSYPRTTVLGDRTCTGRLVLLPDPPHSTSEPILPGMVLGLEASSGDYVLTVDGHWIADESITIAGSVYSVGDEVGITGTASSVKISGTETYLELTVKSITRGVTP